MDFQIACECGEQFRVSPWQAGVRLSCRCGRTVTVPSSMELRASAGLPEIEVALKEQVLSRLRSGELPPPDCLDCGAGSAEVTNFVAHCERLHLEKTHQYHIWSYLFLGLLGLFLFRTSTVREHGRDTVIPVPAGLCTGCRGNLLPLLPLWLLRLLGIGLLIGSVVAFFQSGWELALGLLAGWLVLRFITSLIRRGSQRRIKRTLGKIPLYRQVFDKYPDAFVQIDRHQ